MALTLHLAAAGREIDRFEFAGQQRIRIGRSDDCELTIDHRSVSRFHCEVAVEGEGYVVRDLDSHNGTRLNGLRVAGEMPLQQGDAVTISRFTVRVEALSPYRPEAPAAPAPVEEGPARADEQQHALEARVAALEVRLEGVASAGVRGALAALADGLEGKEVDPTLAPLVERVLRGLARAEPDRPAEATPAAGPAGASGPLPQGGGTLWVPGLSAPPPKADRIAAARAADGADTVRIGPPLSEAGGPPGAALPPWIDGADPQVGQPLAGGTIRGRVGAGAMGVVYLVEDPAHPAPLYAVKVLPPHAPEEARARFKREVLANSFFSHPGALDIYDAGTTPLGEPYLAMEFFPGRDLGNLLGANGRLEPRAGLEVVVQVLETLHAAHQAGVVHRDVKPENVLVGLDGRTARLIDFGIAVLGDLGEFEGQVFRTMGMGRITGTPEYMSPEQANGDEASPASDLYSLACTAFRLLAGRSPFGERQPTAMFNSHLFEEPPTLRAVAPDLANFPSELEELLARLLKKTPSERPDAIEALAALRRILVALG